MARKPRKPAPIEPLATDAAMHAVMVRITPRMLEMLDDWRRKERDLPSRAEAMRRFAVIVLGVEMKPRGRKGRT
jgi:hypothetical protein